MVAHEIKVSNRLTLKQGDGPQSFRFTRPIGRMRRKQKGDHPSYEAGKRMGRPLLTLNIEGGHKPRSTGGL